MKKRTYKKLCNECGKRKASTRIRFCAYHEDVNNEEVKELICDECEYQHAMDI
jgi:hypothetical protein